MQNGNGNHHMRERERLDFSKIQSSIQIPNLIEVQKNVLSAISADGFASVRARRRRPAVGVHFGVSDSGFPRPLAAGFRGLLHRELGMQVRQPEGAASPARHLPQLRRLGGHQSVSDRRRALHQVRHVQQEHAHLLRKVRRSGRHAAEVRRERVPGARHDLRRSAQGHHPSDDLRQGSRHRREKYPRHQGTGSFLRRHSADDRQRHVRHQRHRARHRQPVAPLAGRVLRIGQQPQLFPREDHSVPRLVGRVRVRHQEHSVRAHRPQAQIPGLDFPARAGHEVERRNSAHVLPGRARHAARRRPALEPFRRPDRPQAVARNQESQERRSAGRRAQAHHRSALQGTGQGQGSRGARFRRRSRRRLLRRRSGEPPDRRSAARSQQAADRRNLDGARRSGHHQRGRLLPGSRRRRRGAFAHARQGRHQVAPRSADRNLPQAASRRSADARNRHGAVQRHVLRSAQVRFQPRGPLEIQHQVRPGNAAQHAHAGRRRFRRGHPLPAEAAQEHRHAWTTSITSATAACARSANSSRTSSASAWSAWSAPSRKRCRCTRKCPPPCRTTW